MPTYPGLRMGVDSVSQSNPVKLAASLTENRKKIEDILLECHDIVFQPFTCGEKTRYSTLIVYCKPLTEKMELRTFKSMMEPLISKLDTAGQNPDSSSPDSGMSQPSDMITDMNQAVWKILNGYCIVFIDGWDRAIGIEAYSVSRKQTEQPVSESVIFGPREGSVDELDHNIGLLRIRLKSPQFKIELTQMGELTNLRVMIGYVKDKVNEEALAVLKKRMSHIRNIEVLDATSVREFIEDSKYSPFPQYRITERLDVAVSAMLEGKIILMADGSSTILICPALFIDFFQSPEDYYQRTHISSLVRLMRIIAFFMALSLPSMYIALSNYHPELIPSNLLLTLLNSREGLPFSSFVEALLMQFFFELLREAGIRLPRPVGAAVSIVGALIIGEAAIRAGIASPVMIVVISLTGIASFSMPQYEMAIAIRVFVFPLMVLSYLWGGFGLLIGFILFFLHLTSLHSLGQPYFTPLAPLSPFQLLDVIVRAPLTLLQMFRKTKQAK